MEAELRAGAAGQLPPLALAYVGDAVYELYVRQRLITQGKTRPAHLHRAAVPYVKAEGQARVVRGLLPQLTEAEAALIRRGRNASPGHYPKGANPADYHLATGLEALFGFLHLAGQQERLDELLAKAVRLIEEPAE